ncbi:MAG: ATP synthase F1 subunit gamma [Firmicutes bacterium]|nr:ATP synthase F1 subunit gamma [Bacillota bacterium]
MAGVSTKAIRSRIRSMESTRQITKAMELVAASKLRTAHERALSNRKYFATLLGAMNRVAASTPSFTTPYMEAGSGRPLYIVIGGDRGLAGGYNGNVFRFAHERLPEDALLVPIGKKTLEHFSKRQWQLEMDELQPTSEMDAGSCYTLAKVLCDGFLKGDYSQLRIIYTKVDSLLSQTPKEIDILPLSDFAIDKESKAEMIFEGGGEALFNNIVPEYAGCILYSAVKESFASEQAARRMAMDAASKNADEMIAKLELEFNQARQAAITQEITEIVAGSEG